MSDFKFRLATLLRLRDATRDQRREELANAQRAEEAIRRQMTQLQTEWDHLMSMTRHASRPGAVDIGRLIETHRYQQTLEARRSCLNEQLAALTADLQRRREALLDADRDVRTLEKLRDSQKMRHHQESHRRDITRIDEATQLRMAAANESQTMNLVGNEYHG